jgi:beta-glucosidase/6-phospho-beta-glucosidase/beta-galactosidase
MDNFEWKAGYDLAFGLYHVAFSNGQRSTKDSAAFYKQVIADRAIS